MLCPICSKLGIPKNVRDCGKVYVCQCGFTFSNEAEDSSDPSLYDETWARIERAPTYEFEGGRYVIRNKWKLTQLLDTLKPFKKLNRMLDIGCSVAMFLKLAKDNGWEVQGVEVAEWAAKYSTERLGVPTFNGLLEEAHFPDGSFDVICSSHVMEHVQNPPALVAEMKRILRPGGAIVTTVPVQFKSPTYLFLGGWYGELPPRHVSFFERNSLETLMKQAGLTVYRSQMNVELALIAEHFKVKKTEHKKKEISLEPTGYEHPDPSLPVRAIKTVVNSVATALNIGDDLCTIAVKPCT